MNVFLIEKKGVFKPLDIERSGILEKFEMYTRDLRPMLSQKQVSTVFRRKNAIILNLNGVKMLIGKKDAILFSATGNSFKKLKDFLDDKMADYKGILPFELFLLDKAFFFVLEKLKDELFKIEKEARLVEKSLSDHPTDE